MGLLTILGGLLAILFTLMSQPPEVGSPPPTEKTTEDVEQTPVTFVRKTNSKANGGSKVSKGEDLCRKVISEIIKEKGLVANIKHNFRPDFLKNPRTNRNLELDIFVDVIKPKTRSIAIEFNGRQHDEFVPRFHKTRSEFVNQQYRDKLKRDICKEKEIDLVVVSWFDIDKLKSDADKEKKIREIISSSLPADM